jgi:hypothetical protein
MEYGSYSHQKTYLPMYAAQRRMPVGAYPDHRSRHSADHCQQENPPKDARYSIPIFSEP